VEFLVTLTVDKYSITLLVVEVVAIYVVDGQLVTSTRWQVPPLAESLVTERATGLILLYHHIQKFLESALLVRG
jgi:hypothetical protein